jgi:filamentous hemagglutinin family protein
MKRPSLNHVYRLVWSDILGAFVAVAEGSRGKGKSGDRLLATVLLGSVVLSASAAPAGGVVTSGAAAISQSGAVTNINQSTQKAAINWQGFSIGASETVNFNQPNSSALTLNRVIGNEKSVIEGALNANGKVFLINSNGMLFTQGSSINTGGFVASTLNLTDDDFNAGNYVFKSNGSAGSIINLGTITAKDGGYVALFGNNVSNQGVIVATKGTVALSAGDKITLNFNGDSLLSVSIDEGTLNALVENKQAIYADGGTVYLTAKAADELLGAQVNNSGIVQARTVDDLKGKIELYAHGGTANVDGTLDASAPNGGDGGFVETSGKTVNIADSAFVTTKAANGTSGTWLIDPNDFIVAASGGNATGAALSASLANNGIVTIDTHTMGTAGGNGDITINDAIEWWSDNTLNLVAERNININNAIKVNGAGAHLAMTYSGDYNIRTKASYSGVVLDGNGSPVANTDTSGGVYGSITFTNSANTNGLTINGNTYTLIHSMSQLDLLDEQNSVTGKYYNPATHAYDVVVAKYYCNPATQAYDLVAPAYDSGTKKYYNPVTRLYDLDNASAPRYYNFNTGLYDLSSPFTLIGQYALAQNLTADETSYSTALISNFSGTLTGLGHKVSNLTIADPTVDSESHVYIGLIGQTSSGTTLRDIGIVNANISGNTQKLATTYIGALAGNVAGNVYNTYSTGVVTVNQLGATSANAGGLLGMFSSGNLSYSFSDVKIGNSSNEGGLVGKVDIAQISHVHATGEVTGGANNVGGLIGYANASDVSNSYATGGVTGGNFSAQLGGLIGYVTTKSPKLNLSVTNSFATGDVTGGTDLGGVIGAVVISLGSATTFTVDNTYATGTIRANQPDYIGTGTDGVGGLIGYVAQHALRGTLIVTKSHATGDVILSDNYGQNNMPIGGQALIGKAGGLIGNLSAKVGSSITDSYATGNVYAPTGYGVGGLVGYTGQAVNINRSYATGNVTGKYNVGGLVGTLAGVSNITSSYSSGKAVGLASNAGGLVGSMVSGTIGPGVYYNAEGVSGSNGNAANFTGTDRSRGLTGDAVADMKYYANGTIDQVLADRAEAAKEAEDQRQTQIRESARQQSSIRIASNEVAQALKPATQTTGLSSEGFHTQFAALERNIVFADRNYTADIRSIEVDGKVYQLDEEGGVKEK